MAYNYLKKEAGPKVLVEALKYLGVSEIVGKDHNPEILKWADELGLKNIYTADEIPWCGLYVAIVCKRAGKNMVVNPLWARNWKNWGVPQQKAMLGDVLVFSRGSGGHVGFYVGEDLKCYHVLGGNQNNKVSVTRIVKTRCIGIRRTKWSIKQPDNVRQVFLSDRGIISTNEI